MRRADLAAAAERPAFDVAVDRPWRLLGRGVGLHARLGASCTGLARPARRGLSRPVAHPRRTGSGRAPHVTVQNKVDPAVARALHARLVRGVPSRADRSRARGAGRSGATSAGPGRRGPASRVRVGVVVSSGSGNRRTHGNTGTVPSVDRVVRLTRVAVRSPRCVRTGGPFRASGLRS